MHECSNLDDRQACRWPADAGAKYGLNKTIHDVRSLKLSKFIVWMR